MQTNQQLTIIGGGITGLATAYIAAKSGRKVRVIEASNKFGGLLDTFEIGGNQLEHYYHHFFTHDAELNWFIKELGIADKLFFKKTSMGVFRDGKIYDFNTPIDLLKFSPIGFLGKIKFGLSSIILGKFLDWRKYEGVSTLSWFYKWLGKDTTNALWKPLLDIKFGPFAEKVPLAWMIGRLAQRLNSRKGGDERLGYLQGSLKTLSDALIAKLKAMNVELILNEPLINFDIQNGVLKSIQTKNLSFEDSQFLITIPSLVLPDLLKKDAPKLAEAFTKIEYFGAVCTILELDRPLSHVYWLNVADEGYPFGGVIEHTNFIDKELYDGSSIVYLSRYFAHNEALMTMTEDEIKAVMIPPMKKIYPDFDEAFIKKVYVFKTKTAATVCDLNFSEKVPACKTEIEQLYIANMAHIYPDERSTNNSIRVAAEACRVMGIDSDFVPKGASLSGKIGF
jgi:protoporphyrinogen oxidase